MLGERAGIRTQDLLISTTVAFSLTAVVSGGGLGLVLSSPVRPGHDKAGSDWGPEQKSGQKIADLGHCRQKRRQAHQAAAGTAGLLSFALPHVARRRSAVNRARKAAAAKHKLMCRCHPCQERASQWSSNYPRPRLWRSQVTALRMAPNTLVPGVRRAVSTTVRMAASPSAAHIAR